MPAITPTSTKAIGVPLNLPCGPGSCVPHSTRIAQHMGPSQATSVGATIAPTGRCLHLPRLFLIRYPAPGVDHVFGAKLQPRPKANPDGNTHVVKLADLSAIVGRRRVSHQGNCLAVLLSSWIGGPSLNRSSSRAWLDRSMVDKPDRTVRGA